MYRKLTLVTTTLLVSVAFTQIGGSTGSAASGGHASTPGGPDDSIAQSFIQAVGATAIDNQDALSTFRAWMITQPGFADSGYVGSSDDLQHKATTILWSGSHTALLSAIISEGERRGIAVSVQERRYSLQQLDAAANAISKQAASGGWAGFTISAIAEVGITENGLTVYGTYTATPAAQRAPQVQSLATTVLGVPVHVVPGVSVVSAVGGTGHA